MVRAKFQVQSVSPANVDKPEDGATITLLLVTGGSPENDSFYKWTPAGAITLSTVNEEAANKFKVGDFFYVDFNQAEG